MSTERIDRLVSQFNGAIKYAPMLQDHGEHVADERQRWTDEQCVAFAKRWHAVAAERYKSHPKTWNHGIPYARNIWKDTNA